MSEQHVNTFVGGMDQETSVSKYPNDKYYYSEELRLVTHEGLTSGSLNSVKGNSLQFALPAEVGKIHGHGFIRDKLVLFTHNPEATQGNPKDGIFYFGFDESVTTSSNELRVSTLEEHVKFRGDLEFDDEYPIKKVLGRYEANNIEKVYWTDGHNTIRYANLSENILSYTLDRFDFLPDIEFDTLNVDTIGSGNLKVGVVQYAYQFYNLRGSESIYSPPTVLIDLAPKSLFLSDTRQFAGGDIGDNSGKSVTVSMNLSEDNLEKFDRVRILRIHHEDINLLPIIDIVSEQEITNVITFTDSGNISLETIPTEFYREIRNLVICQDIDVKNNYLFPAGLREEYFDFNFDARAYRFSDSGASTNFSNYVTISNNHVVFNKPIVFRDIAKAGITTAPDNWDQFWYLENDIIYLLAPLNINENVDLTAYSDTSPSASGDSMNDIYTYDGTKLSFGGRQIHSTVGIAATDEELDFPMGWTPGTMSSVEAVLQGSSPITISGASPDWDVADNHDAINPFNEVDYPGTEYKYKTDGITIGGEGPNVEYEFATRNLLIDESGDLKYFYAGTETGNSDNPSYTSYASPYIKALYTGYQRDEIYSFGIVGYDSKGRQSFVSWIGDIRFPSELDTGFELIEITGTNIYAKILYIKFKVSNLPEDVESYQIVRCPRTRQDRTVLDSGILGSLGTIDTAVSDEYPGRFILPLTNAVLGEADTENPGSYICNRVFEYTSPEVNFNKQNIQLVTNSINIIGIGHVNREPIFSTRMHANNTTYAMFIDKITNYTTSATHSGTYKNLIDIKLFESALSSDVGVTLDGLLIKNQVFDAVIWPIVSDKEDLANSNYRGTTIVLRLEEGLTEEDRTFTNVFKVARRRHISPYQGNTYNSRTNRTYIPCSYIIDPTYADFTDCYQGDTYIDFFDHLRVIWNGERPADHRVSSVVYFPIETTINMPLRLDNHMNKLYNGNTGEDPTEQDKYVGLKEVAGVHYVSPSLDYFSQARDLYQYNSVYSKANNIKEFIAKPFDFDLLSNQEFDYRVTVTDKKINGEMSDSWTKIRFNNIIEVDSKYGPITALYNYGNMLLYFQPEAVGVLSVEEREMTQSTTAGTLTLGTGGVLSRYDYISTIDGCRDNFSLVPSKSGLYFFDRINNVVSKLGESVEEVSKILGMQPYFNKNVDNSGIVRGAYNRMNNEVLFTYNGDTPFTIAVDEYAGMFTTFYAYKPTYYINHNQDLYSSENRTSLYKHNVGNISSYYGGAPADSKLTIVINPGSNVMCRYDVIQFLTEVMNITTGSVVHRTFSTLRAYNSYQDTGVLDMDILAKRRMKVWRYNKLRDQHTNSPSLKDTYLIVELTFNNNSNESVRIDDIVTMFQPIRIH